MRLNLAVLNNPPAALTSRYARITEAKNWVRYTQTNHWMKTQMPITLSNLALACGMAIKEVLHEFMSGKRETDGSAEKILSLKEKVRRREAVFVEGHGVYWIPYQEPKLMPPMIKRTDEEDWHMTSTCRACSNNQYLPAEMNTDYYALCFHCIPPNQYAAIGAISQEGSMIAYALEVEGILEDIRLLHEKPEEVNPEPVIVPKVYQKRGPKPKKRKMGWSGVRQ
jgi:hypothetical protein